MKYRNSTNSMHLLNGMLVGGDDRWAVGVQLTPNTTGAQAIVEAVGDSTVVDLTLRAKGTGGVVRLGSSAGGGGVVLGSTGVLNSSAMTAMPIKGVFQSSIAFTNAAISSGQVAEITIASTAADISPGDLVGAEILYAAIPAAVYGGYRTSTAAASRLTLLVAVPGSSATATLSGTIRVTWMDLT